MLQSAGHRDQVYINELVTDWAYTRTRSPIPMQSRRRKPKTIADRMAISFANIERLVIGCGASANISIASDNSPQQTETTQAGAHWFFVMRPPLQPPLQPVPCPVGTKRDKQPQTGGSTQGATLIGRDSWPRSHSPSMIPSSLPAR